MVGKKGMITSNNQGSLHSCYHILDNIELSAPREGETLRDHYDDSICLNEETQGAAPNWGVPLRWSEGLPEVKSIEPEEIEGLPFFGAPTASTGGSLALVPRQPNHRAHAEERLKKKKCLVKVGHAGQGSTTLDKEGERLARLALSCEEAHRLGLVLASPEASMGPAPLRLVPSSILVVDVECDVTSPAPTFERELPETLAVERDEARNDAKDVVLAKQDLERAFEEAKSEATIVQLQKLDVDLSSELGATKAEVATFRDQVVNLDTKEVKLSSKLESSQAEITRLQVRIEVPQTRSSWELKVVSAVKRREEFERSHYDHDGFIGRYRSKFVQGLPESAGSSMFTLHRGREASQTEFGQLLACTSKEVSTRQGFTHLVADPSSLLVPPIEA
ncbi:hypothetical protein ACLOJK_039071 [Asimina triloba]